MKIIKVEKLNEDPNGVFTVTRSPNWLEKLFGLTERVEKYKATGNTYFFGGGNVYVNQLGEKLLNRSSIGEAIDKFRRSW